MKKKKNFGVEEMLEHTLKRECISGSGTTQSLRAKAEADGDLW